MPDVMFGFAFDDSNKLLLSHIFERIFSGMSPHFGNISLGIIVPRWWQGRGDNDFEEEVRNPEFFFIAEGMYSLKSHL
jgi:hypothetical protein